MTLRGTLTDRRAGLIAERLRVLGQPLRVKLLDRLATQAITVQGLVGSLETTTERLAASRHPAKSRMVSRHKEGTRVRYELVDPHIVPLLERAGSAPLRTTSANSQNRSSQALSVGGFRLVSRRHPGPPGIEGSSLRRQINDR